ncbi:MAG: hypothetical protein JST51_01445 [Armatimonadetes bacterium]|nr:hypothetical protein [Armatimonadota bacterium]
MNREAIMKSNFTTQTTKSLTTAWSQVWTTNASRTGIEVAADIANSGYVQIVRVNQGDGAPGAGVLPDHTLSAGQTFESDNRYSDDVDVYARMNTGTGSAKFTEVS